MEEKKDLSKLEAGSVMPEQPPPPYQSNTAQLPSYEKAVSDGPPSYSSLYADLIRSKEQCDGKEMAKVLGTFCQVVAGSIIGLIFLGIMVAIPISMIVMGAMHLRDCRAERFIPIYLVVGGSFGLFESLCNMCKRKKEKKRKESQECDEDEDNPRSCLSGFTGLISCFLFAWFIAGNVWVYRTYNAWSPVEGAANYCHPTLYWYSFWIITATYIFIGVCVVFFIVVGCCVCIFAKQMDCSSDKCGQSGNKEGCADYGCAQNLP